MAVDYTPGESGSMVVVKSMTISNTNESKGQNVAYDASGYAMAPMKALEVPPNIRVVKGMAPSATLMTGATGSR